ncbi:MAG TPA: hypothetical protein VFN61_07600 [Acidimicrobiales bacterium]|nr:hypothetical protein [Acidimicrobiales bacterium]
MPVDVVCPTCNTVSHLSDVTRDSDSFCRTCDYPLFWARQTTFAATKIDLTDGPGLRRLPGTEGWAVSERIVCPTCSEPNLVAETMCVRCGSDLRPRQLPPIYVPATPLPSLEPPAQRQRRRDWVPAVVVLAFAVECLLIWLIGAYWH